jgi:Ca2+-transporting ATPase
MTVETLFGLSNDEAATRLASIGANSLQAKTGRGLPQILMETLREPMFLLLIGATLLYLGLGDVAEGLFLLVGACATIGLVVIQEARSEHALAALRNLTQPFARVIRGGEERQIAISQLVPGDIVLIGEGERLPADAVQVSGEVLSVDESALTGESASVIKRPLKPGEAIDQEAPPGSEESPYLFAGTMVVRGQAVLRVLLTGARTSLGRIGMSLATLPTELTPLQKTAGKLVKVLGLFALAFCGLVTLAYGVMRHDWFGGALAGLTVSIALIPEEFPMILAVFLAFGAWRLARDKVLVRRSSAIEALGSATVLCVDKTGTLTTNQMQVTSVWTPAGDHKLLSSGQLGEAESEVMRIAGLASAVVPVDPMDKAIRTLAAAVSEKNAAPERIWPLRSDRMTVIQAWSGEAGRYPTAAKGAPEAVLRLCGLSADDAEAKRLEAQVEVYANQGLRVLAVAFAELPDTTDDAPDVKPFTLKGVVAFEDPLRDGVVQALLEAKTAGLTVIMITGDHPATALAIAKKAGLDTSGGVMLGSELAQLTLPELTTRLATIRVFARIVPSQKLLIVQALKARGDVVAMTGDGINDAPALKATDIGIAMGRKGTDVAREAAALVLVDDSFASIVGGVRTGRRIFANLRKALIYVTAIHIPIAGVALAPILIGLPPLLLPMHVVLLELAIDPICAMVFESEPGAPGAMAQPPRKAGEPLFGLQQLLLAVAQGAVILAGVLGVYLWALGQYPVDEARGAAFITLVTANLVLALTDAVSVGSKVFAPHRWIYGLIASGAAALLAIGLAVPGFATVFMMTPPEPLVWVAAVTAAAVTGGWFAVVKRLPFHLAFVTGD